MSQPTESTDPIAATARTVAHQLTDQYGPHLPADVEAALQTNGDRSPQQYLDPVSLGGLIVAVATLAWAAYQDLKKSTPQPPPTVITRTIRLRLTDTAALPTHERDRIIDLTVTETIQTAKNRPTQEPRALGDGRSAP